MTAIKNQNMDFTRKRAFVYHPDYEPKMVYSEEVGLWYKKGWVDSPAKYGQRMEPEVIAESLIIEEPEPDPYKLPNGFEYMGAKALDNWSRDNLNEELDARMKPKTLRRRILSIIEKKRQA